MIKKILFILERRQKRNLVILVFLMLFGGIMELIGVSAVLPFVNIVMYPEQIEKNIFLTKVGRYLGIETFNEYVLMMVIALILIYLIKNIYIIILYDLQYRFTFNNQQRLGTMLMACYMKQDYTFFLDKNSSVLLRNIQSDVPQFFNVVLQMIQLIAEAIVCSCLFLFLMVQDFVIIIGLLVILLFFLGLFFWVFRKYSVRLGIQLRYFASEVNKWLLQAFSGIKETKISNKELFFIENYELAYREYTKIMKKQGVLGSIPKPTIESLCICAILSMVAIRICLGGNNDEFIPTLSVFAVAAFRMLPSFNRITGYLNNIMYGKASIEAVYNDIIEANAMSNTKKDLNGKTFDSFQKIEIQNLTFKYPNSNSYVINNISFNIMKNTSIAFIGSSGSGKTTLADIILGILLPQHGAVLVDGVNIQDDLQAWHNSIGYIPQTIYLLDDTIANNIAYGVKVINKSRIEEVLEEAQLSEFVHSLPEGIDTKVGERGVRLSGGQRQRIGIARALYGRPQILVLDEATSALDNETEQAVMNAINHLQGRKTMIIIAHRLTTIKNCDIIYEVKDSKLSVYKNSII